MRLAGMPIFRQLCTVEIGASTSLATALVPPSASMILLASVSIVAILRQSQLKFKQNLAILAIALMAHMILLMAWMLTRFARSFETGKISAGRWREGFETVIDWVYSPDPSLSANAFVVIVDGDSMDKVADPGDRIIIEPRDRRLISGKLYVIRNGNGETTFKRYMDNPARLEPCSNSDRHEVIYPGEDGFEVIGRAVMKATDL